MKEIPLTNGMVALIDDDDFERVSSYSSIIPPIHPEGRSDVQTDTTSVPELRVGDTICEFYYDKELRELHICFGQDRVWKRYDDDNPEGTTSPKPGTMTP